MRRGAERDQRLVESRCLPIRFASAPISLMSGKTVNDVVAAPVLILLLLITGIGLYSWRVEQRQTQHTVGGFVTAVFVRRQDSHAISTTSIGQIKPLVTGHFILPGIIVGALDLPKFPIIRRQRIGHGQRKLCLQRTGAALP